MTKILTLESEDHLDDVRARLRALGHDPAVLRGAAPDEAPSLAIVGRRVGVDLDTLRALDGVAAVWSADSPHPLLDRHEAQITIERGDKPPIRVGEGAAPTLIAGPCSVESPEQIEEVAARCADAGASILRGGCFKPRTSPHSFQGTGLDGLRWMREAADAHGLAVVTEALDPRHVDAVAEVADILQIGSRNMQNFALLRAAGAARRPVLLKRSFAATLDEWLLAIEHLLAAGAPAVLPCERGVRGFDRQTRFMLDLGAVATLRQAYGMPVIVDPSHAAGRRDLVAPLARAALACGASGLMVEVHPDPGRARSDGAQQITPAEFEGLVASLPLEAG